MFITQLCPHVIHPQFWITSRDGDSPSSLGMSQLCVYGIILHHSCSDANQFPSLLGAEPHPIISHLLKDKGYVGHCYKTADAQQSAGASKAITDLRSIKYSRKQTKEHHILEKVFFRVLQILLDNSKGHCICEFWKFGLILACTWLPILQTKKFIFL